MPTISKLTGNLVLEEMDKASEETPLFVYAFTNKGKLVGKSVIDKGAYEISSESLDTSDLTLVLAPEMEPEAAWEMSPVRVPLDSKLAKPSPSLEKAFVYPALRLRPEIWRPLLPRLLSISGRVRNTHADGRACNVAFCKVEIYDVDRERRLFIPFSKAKIAEAQTDANGRYSVLRLWSPFHFRSGQLRFDLRPDLLVRVTQTVNGVTRVIYNEGYPQTRWDQLSAHIDIDLHDESVVCLESGDPIPTPVGGRPSVTLTRIGNDRVLDIGEASGRYAAGGLSDVQYGSTLDFWASFSQGFSLPGQKRYYRLSYAPVGSASFTPVSTALSDTRFNLSTVAFEDVPLGPFVVNGVPGLYEVRDTTTFPHWSYRDRIGVLDTSGMNGQLVFRLEVFDANGHPITHTTMDYIDHHHPALPSGRDNCQMRLDLNNHTASVQLTMTGAAVNANGVLPAAQASLLGLRVQASLPDGRLYAWSLGTQRGLNPTSIPLGSASSGSGFASIDTTVTASTVSPPPWPFVVSETTAFSIRLQVTRHVRTGYGMLPSGDVLNAIAVDHCACPPK